MKPPTGEVTPSFKKKYRAEPRGAGLVATVTMAVAEVYKSEVGVVK